MPTRSNPKGSLSVASLRRMDTMERNQADQARQIGALTDELGEIKKRVTNIEVARATRAEFEARVEERGKARDRELDDKFKHLEKKIDDNQSSTDKRLTKIESNGDKLFWIVVGAVAVAVVGWLLSGGLKIPT